MYGVGTGVTLGVSDGLHAGLSISGMRCPTAEPGEWSCIPGGMSVLAQVYQFARVRWMFAMFSLLHPSQ